ncbi:MAG: LytTR family DNA-binding domain-containing protein [Zoogloeaceae bacterium]|jgi:two-component system response regulator AlgR|nr:LytTR family DNA-binding domain-containing protein [Zoogloeaceae bacterium]
MLSLLIVDDEDLARLRLRELLSDIASVCPTRIIGEAGDGILALAWLQSATEPPDLLLADIHMPRMGGLELAAHLEKLQNPPAVIFTTAYDNHAVQAFELNAVDYLLKPVRAQRLLTALEKVRQHPGEERGKTGGQLAALQQQVNGGRSYLTCHERGRLLLVPLAEVLYFKADLKYVIARTPEREYVLDETITGLEAEFPETFLRLHRAALIARHAIAGLERAREDDDAYGYALFRQIPDKLPISRRQWPVARSLVREQ